MSVRRFIVSPVACRITPNSAFNLRHQNRKGCRVKWEGSAANMHYSNPEPSMSQLGHSLQVRPRPLVHKCPLCINTDRKFWALGFVAMCHKRL